MLDNSTPIPTKFPMFPLGLQAAGYETAFVGKWRTDGFSADPRPGFDHWVSFRGQEPYENFTLNINGERVDRQGHTTDLLGDYAEDFLNVSVCCRPRAEPRHSRSGEAGSARRTSSRAMGWRGVRDVSAPRGTKLLSKKTRDER